MLIKFAYILLFYCLYIDYILIISEWDANDRWRKGEGRVKEGWRKRTPKRNWINLFRCQKNIYRPKDTKAFSPWSRWNV